MSAHLHIIRCACRCCQPLCHQINRLDKHDICVDSCLPLPLATPRCLLGGRAGEVYCISPCTRTRHDNSLLLLLTSDMPIGLWLLLLLLRWRLRLPPALCRSRLLHLCAAQLLLLLLLLLHICCGDPQPGPDPTEAGVCVSHGGNALLQHVPLLLLRAGFRLCLLL